MSPAAPSLWATAASLARAPHLNRNLTTDPPHSSSQCATRKLHSLNTICWYYRRDSSVAPSLPSRLPRHVVFDLFAAAVPSRSPCTRVPPPSSPLPSRSRSCLLPTGRPLRARSIHYVCLLAQLSCRCLGSRRLPCRSHWPRPSSYWYGPRRRRSTRRKQLRLSR